MGGGQHEVKLPQCSDLFGRKGLSFLDKLELPAPAKLLLTQQLALLKELAVRIHEDEKALEGLTSAAAGGRTQTGVAAELLSRGEALDAVDLGDDHSGQDRSHTGKAAHVLERRTLLKQAFQGFLILADAHGQFL